MEKLTKGDASELIHAAVQRPATEEQRARLQVRREGREGKGKGRGKKEKGSGRRWRSTQRARSQVGRNGGRGEQGEKGRETQSEGSVRGRGHRDEGEGSGECERLQEEQCVGRGSLEIADQPGRWMRDQSSN